MQVRYRVFDQNDRPLGECDTAQQVIDMAANYLGDDTERRVYAVDSAPTVHYPVLVVKRCNWGSYAGLVAWEGEHFMHQSHAPGFDTCAAICAAREEIES